MERWKLTWTNRSAMLGEVPAMPRVHETEAATEGLDEPAIVDMLHHIIAEHTGGAGVLTDAERI